MAARQLSPTQGCTSGLGRKAMLTSPALWLRSTVDARSSSRCSSCARDRSASVSNSRLSSCRTRGKGGGQGGVADVGHAPPPHAAQHAAGSGRQQAKHGARPVPCLPACAAHLGAARRHLCGRRQRLWLDQAALQRLIHGAQEGLGKQHHVPSAQARDAAHLHTTCGQRAHAWPCVHMQACVSCAGSCAGCCAAAVCSMQGAAAPTPASNSAMHAPRPTSCPHLPACCTPRRQSPGCRPGRCP
jgi:hypothetical protein